ncbi:glycosyl-4,4'-diaponeurosporenoate acyltransferase CrtO family protein [Rufibacter psychrotolerans]|uniref:glycosyl-4,4'-diaponeurosporenoate acyltransferase CrtO family protein n=1 Tax=Rufibacter psychrotolerans TaxID=2812556 RepID=UPI00196844F8|nr:hypothetical protein [Rufibacter sp. SYSU D00308]
MAWYTALVALSVPKLNSRYFNSYRFEQEGRIYEYLGVHFYRKLLVWTGWEKVSRKANPIRKDLASLTTADRNSRTSEAGHLVIAVIVFAVAGLVMRSWSEARWLLVLNVVLNIYPVLLQRFNRPRYRRVLVALQKNAAVQNKHGSLIK